MKITNMPTLTLTTREREKIVDVVSMLYSTDPETDEYLDNIMEDMRGCSLLDILEEILNRAQISG